MKTKIILFVALMFAATITTKAQQGFQRKTVEERVKLAVQTISDSLKLDKTQQDSTTAILTDFYKTQNKMREDARASGNRPDRSVFEKMANDRDEKLKTIFTGDQYKKFKDVVEPSMRQQRPGGGQGNG